MTILHCSENESEYYFTTGKNYNAIDHGLYYLIHDNNGHEKHISKDNMAFITKNDYGKGMNPAYFHKMYIKRAYFKVIED